MSQSVGVNMDEPVHRTSSRVFRWVRVVDLKTGDHRARWGSQ